MGDSYQYEDIEVFYTGGEGSPRKSVTGGPVRIEDIRKTHDPFHLYEDPDFPADLTSIGNVGGDAAAGSGSGAARTFDWLRSFQLTPGKLPVFADNQNPSLSEYRASEFDINQGGLADCWYVVAVAALTGRQDKLAVVIPEDNYTGFDKENYCGAFHFRFYDMDTCKWVDIVVDDRIPCIRGPQFYQPAFADIETCPGTKEFWVALLEKAFAKFFGNYQKIENGSPSQALENLTGGFGEAVIFYKEAGFGAYQQKFKDVTGEDTSPEELIKRQIVAYKGTGGFIALGTPLEKIAEMFGVLEGFTDWGDSKWVPDPTTGLYKSVPLPHGIKKNADGQYVPDKETKGLGLCPCHAYTVIDAVDVPKKDESGSVFLLKVKNPHHKNEWFGQYSDGDDSSWNEFNEWNDLRVRETDGLTREEGIFWISLKDVMKYFMDIEYCLFGLDDCKFTFVQDVWPKKLQESALNIQSDPNPNKILHNYPVYKFEAQQVITKTLAEEKGVEFNECIVCITIVLNGFHCAMLPAVPKFTYYLYKVTDDELSNTTLEQLFNSRKADKTGKLSSGREASGWEHVQEGTYLLVPALDTVEKQRFGPELAGKDVGYTIRLFTENETTLERIA